MGSWKLVDVHYFTTYNDNLVDVLRNDVIVFPYYADDGTVNKTMPTDMQFWTAIWDTGASRSAISDSVAETLSLKPISQTRITTAAGVVMMPVHKIVLGLPNGIFIEREVTQCPLPGGDRGDLLIGMDVIGMGDFIVSNYNSRTIVTFRIPSMMSYDFSYNRHLLSWIALIRRNRIIRNEPCPCGSGKKTKHCHGKNSLYAKTEVPIE